ncbi:MAG: hypothetical protein IIC71_06895 [Acidobacteria bacterium]|nr:hypothetical protein [Acidobacteriota bacterium]
MTSTWVVVTIAFSSLLDSLGNLVAVPPARPSFALLTGGLVGAGFKSAAFMLVTVNPLLFFSIPLELFARPTVYTLSMLVMRRQIDDGDPVPRWLVGVAMRVSLVAMFALITLCTAVGGPEGILD